jgi:chorismate mutase
MHELDALRTRIDAIDEQIIQLLADRFRVTEEVGLLKKRYQLQADPGLVQHIFACVIQEVVRRPQVLSA